MHLLGSLDDLSAEELIEQTNDEDKYVVEVFLKKLEKLKPYALWLNLQPKRLLALTSNDRRESQLEKQRSLAEELGN